MKRFKNKIFRFKLQVKNYNFKNKLAKIAPILYIFI